MRTLGVQERTEVALLVLAVAAGAALIQLAADLAGSSDARIFTLVLDLGLTAVAVRLLRPVLRSRPTPAPAVPLSPTPPPGAL